MPIKLVNGTERQQGWWNEAVAAFGIPVAKMATIEVAWVAEPSAPGHKEFACCIRKGNGSWRIEIRNNLDDPNRDPARVYSGKAFYQETCVHELGHVVTGLLVVQARKIPTVAAMFERAGEEGQSPETPPDAAELTAMWEAGDWSDHISEACAETIKDLWLPLPFRRYLNRTNWRLKREDLGAFVDLLNRAGQTIEFEGHVYERAPVQPLQADDPDPGSGRKSAWDTYPEFLDSTPPFPWNFANVEDIAEVRTWAISEAWPSTASVGGTIARRRWANNIVWPHEAARVGNKFQHLLTFNTNRWPRSPGAPMGWQDALPAHQPAVPYGEVYLSTDPWVPTVFNTSFTHPRHPYPQELPHPDPDRQPYAPTIRISAGYPVHADHQPWLKAIVVEYDPSSDGYTATPESVHSYIQVDLVAPADRLTDVSCDIGVWFPRQYKIPMPRWPYAPERLLVGDGPDGVVRRSRP